MRKHAFAGSFYPRGRDELQAMINEFLLEAAAKNPEKKQFLSYVAPHAGYVYSGKTAAYTYNAIANRDDIGYVDTIVIVGPNHTGYGTRISVSAQDWETPIGNIANDLELSNAIVECSGIAGIDETAHAQEHSIEVQLPFIQTISHGKKAVFICMGDQSLGCSEDLANAITKAEKELGRKILVVASSDFNHYESAEVGKGKDMKLIDAIKAMDYERFNALVGELEDTICGFGPITVSLLYAKAHGGMRGELLKYANSGEASGDYESAVCYASIGFC